MCAKVTTCSRVGIITLSQTILDRVSAEIRQHMDGIAALADQLARHPMANDAEACAAGVAGSAASLRRMLDRAMDIRATDEGALAATQETIRLSDLVDDLQELGDPRPAGRRFPADLHDGRAGRRRHRRSSSPGPDVRRAGRRGRRRRRTRQVEIGLKAQAHGGEIRIEGRVRGARAWSSAEASSTNWPTASASRRRSKRAWRAACSRHWAAACTTNPAPAAVLVFEFTLPAVQQGPAEPRNAPCDTAARCCR